VVVGLRRKRGEVDGGGDGIEGDIKCAGVRYSQGGYCLDRYESWL